MRRLIAVMLWCLLFSLVAAAHPVPLAAVFEVDSTQALIPAEALPLMSQHLHANIARSRRYLAIPDEQLAERLARVIHPETGCDDDCLTGLAKALDAQAMVFAHVVNAGNLCMTTVIIRASDRSWPDAVGRSAASCSNVQALVDSVRLAAEQALGLGSVPAPDASRPPVGLRTGETFDVGADIENPLREEFGVINVTTNGPSALIRINGSPAGTASPALLIPIMVGQYVVTAERQGYHPTRQLVELTSEGVNVSFQMAPAVGTLDVTSEPSNARVLIDGVPVGETPTVIRDIASGWHRLEVAANHRETDARWFYVRDNAQLEHHSELQLGDDVASDYGSIEVTATYADSRPCGQECTVHIDGLLVGRLGRHYEVPSGTHQIEVRCLDSTASASVFARAAQVTSVSIAMITSADRLLCPVSHHCRASTPDQRLAFDMEYMRASSTDLTSNDLVTLWWVMAKFRKFRGDGKVSAAAGKPRDGTAIYHDRQWFGYLEAAHVAAAMLRGAHIPVRMLLSLDVDRIQDLRRSRTRRHPIANGHAFLEVLLDGRWLLLDPVRQVLYLSYKPVNLCLPSKQIRFAFGGDMTDLGIYDQGSLDDAMQIWASENPGEISACRDPDYSAVRLSLSLNDFERRAKK